MSTKEETLHVEQAGMTRGQGQGHGHNHVLTTDDPNDPMNWSKRRRNGILIIIAVNAFLTTYIAAAHLTSFFEMAAVYERTVVQISYSIGYTILGTAVGPVFWAPLTNRIGRRPVYIISTFLLLCFTVWCSRAATYDEFCAARFLVGMGGSASQVIAPMTIADMFPKEVRGAKMSLWITFLTAGPFSSPILNGFVSQYLSFRWIYYIDAMLVAVNLACILLFVKETKYDALTRSQNLEPKILKRLTPSSIGSIKSYAVDAAQPILLSRFLVILLPVLYYMLVFGWSVGITVLVPQTYGPPVVAGGYGFQTYQVGLLFISCGAGTFLGEYFGGRIGDLVMAYYSKRNNGLREPEFRLYAAAPGMLLLPTGLLLFHLSLQNHLRWFLSPIGILLYCFGQCILTGVISTYVVDCYVKQAHNVTVIFNFIKCCFSFAIPFWVKIDTKTIVIEMVLLMVLGLSLFPALIVYGKRLRRWQGMPAHPDELREIDEDASDEKAEGVIDPVQHDA